MNVKRWHIVNRNITTDVIEDDETGNKSLYFFIPLNNV